jgi:uncharacterized protein YecE (DUF72 family)
MSLKDKQPELWIGTSGWVYKHWNGDFYPAGVTGDRQLPYYAERFPTVEINYSFYHLPERKVFEGWRRQSPEGFLFAVKGSRFLTHMKKLKEPEEPLARLMNRAGGLEEKLGPILFQFPHTWHVNVERLTAFLEALRPYGQHRFSCEFRHLTWLNEEVFRLLERAGVALCLPVHPHMPVDVRLTAPWTYVRMHAGREGIGYKDDELSEWAGHIGQLMDQGADAYVYFNNDIGGHAPRDAVRLREMLTGRSTERVEAVAA